MIIDLVDRLLSSGCIRIGEVNKEIVKVFNLYNDDKDTEIALKRPPCEVRLCGSGILGITASLLGMGPWVTGQFGEDTWRFLKITHSTLEYLLRADFPPIGSNVTCAINRDVSDSEPYLTWEVHSLGGVYSLGVGMPTRTCRNALEALQLAHGAIFFSMYQDFGKDSIQSILRVEQNSLIYRMSEKLRAFSKRLSALELKVKGFTATQLQKQQDNLCSMMGSFATGIMDQKINFDIEEVSDLIIEGASELHSGYEPLLSLLKALAGEGSREIVNAATLATRMRIMRNRNTEDNLWAAMLSCVRRTSLDNFKTEESLLYMQGEQFGTNAINNQLDVIYRSAWKRIRGSIERNVPTLTAYDNMSQKFSGKDTRLIAKEVKMLVSLQVLAHYKK